MLKNSGIWTGVTDQEKALLKILCVKRTVATGEKITLKSLLYSLVKLELQKAIASHEIDPRELEKLFNERFESVS